MTRFNRLRIILILLPCCINPAGAAEMIIGFPDLGNDQPATDPNQFANEPEAITLPPLERGEFEMTIQPATEIPAVRYRLLPIQKEQTNQDGAELYAAAYAALRQAVDPNDWDWPGWLTQIRQHPDDPEMRQAISQSGRVLEQLAQAARCSRCEWPKADPYDNDAYERTLEQVKPMTYLVAIQAHSRIHQGEFEQAADALRTGLAMARQMTADADLMLALEGAQLASLMLEEIEYWISRPAAPSLYRALQDLPRPLVPVGGITQYSPPVERSRYYRYRSPMILEERSGPVDYPEGSYFPLFQRIERWKAMVQFVESLRYVAALNDGRLPKDLSTITETALPLDPITHGGFHYRFLGDTLLVEAPRTDNPAFDTEPMRYRLQLGLIE